MTTPTISSVTGTVSTGQVLTISGANMLNEQTSGLDSFFTSHPTAWSFEGANPTADGYGAIGPSDGIYDSSFKLIGSKSMRFNVSGASVNCPIDNLGDYNAINPEGTDANEYWIRAYAAWNLTGGGWPRSHIKFIDCQGSGPQWYLQPAATTGALPSQFLAVHSGGTGHAFDIPSGQLENGRWYCFEIHWKSTPTRVYEVWIDNQLVYSASPSDQGSLDYLLFGVINCCLTDSAFALANYFDGFVVKRTGRAYPSSLVEIGNSSNYATATKVVQQPLSIGETSQQIKCNLTGLGAGPYYLFVTNNAQERSAGYSLSGTVIAPTANFSMSVSSGQAPLLCTLTDTSTGGPTSWSWDFDTSANNATTPDTASTQGPHAVTYDYGGSVSSQLTVSNSAGNDSETKTIPVRYLKPTNFSAG